jgi:2-polyprenyl-3-methyl-5-hydroxy-6-metoxy-1,4-benzoquinol methylase
MIVCDLCGSDQSQPVLHSHNLDGPLLRCTACGLYYVTSRHSQLTFGGSASPDEVTARLHEANRGFQHLRLEEEHRLALLNARWRLDIIRQFCPSGRLLEVGCARGDFLKVAREKFEVCGVEPNPELAESARTVTAIHQNVVETFTDRDFDVAASFHVIEHVDSPKRFLAAMAERVKTGGIVTIETPNIDSWGFRLFRAKWREFIPEHYYFFDPVTVRQLFENQGLKVERVFKVGKYASVELILNRLGRYGGVFGVVAHFAGLAGVSRATLKINPGDIMLVVGRKS